MDTLRIPGDVSVEDSAVEILQERELPNQKPLVSVIVSLYNYGQYIAGCLDSVYTQTLDSLDLVVVDDCSTDASPRVVSAWLEDHGGRFARYRFLRHRHNRGLAQTRNVAVAHAVAPLVFILDADNLLYPRCIESLRSALENSAASFAYCYVETFGDKSGLINVLPWDPGLFPDYNAIDAMVLLRRTMWQQLGGYSTDMPVMGWEDFDLWFKIARAKGWGMLVPEILARYRVHGTSMLNAVTNPKADLLWAYLRARYPEFFPDQPTEFFNYQRCRAA